MYAHRVPPLMMADSNTLVHRAPPGTVGARSVRFRTTRKTTLPITTLGSLRGTKARLATLRLNPTRIVCEFLPGQTPHRRYGRKDSHHFA